MSAMADQPIITDEQKAEAIRVVSDFSGSSLASA
jgi:hypothetical protein